MHISLSLSRYKHCKDSSIYSFFLHVFIAFNLRVFLLSLGILGAIDITPQQEEWKALWLRETETMMKVRRSNGTVEVGSLSHNLQGVIHPKWLFGISSNGKFEGERILWRTVPGNGTLPGLPRLVVSCEGSPVDPYYIRCSTTSSKVAGNANQGKVILVVLVIV